MGIIQNAVNKILTSTAIASKVITDGKIKNSEINKETERQKLALRKTSEMYDAKLQQKNNFLGYVSDIIIKE